MKLSHSSIQAQVTYTGRVDLVSPYHAFIIVEGLDKDISVAHIHLQGAMHGDMVKVRVISEKREGRKEGRVVEILSRKHTKVVGCVAEQRGKKVVIPDHKRLHHSIGLAKSADHKKLQMDDKVVLKLIQYPTDRKQAEGKVVKVLGPKGSHEAEVNAILEEYDLRYEFPADVQKLAAAFPDEPESKEVARRRDFTRIPTFTIDPVDAKDFDDALSIQELDNGHYQVGIHIADVSHYVKEKGPIDEEAFKRGTSVYLVGTCIPMLPERLANDLCSLKPNTRRLAFSVVITLDQQAQVQEMWVGESVIYSAKRFSYKEAKQLLDKQEGTFYRELRWLNTLAKQLRNQRLKKGAIAFESTELSISLDEKGYPIQIVPKKSSETNQLIEEFMLLANKLIAEKIYANKQGAKNSPTFVYRMHDKPDAEKLEELALYAKQLGYQFVPTSKDLGKEFNKLLSSVHNTPHQTIIHTLAIRTMAQACYTTAPKGHFGLAYPRYTHFTSPIRRYPDLVVHRLCKAYLNNKPAPEKNWYDTMTTHASSRERIAIEAERTSINSKQVLYMKQLEGRVYEGVICGITAWGIYVQLIKNKCEGMVKVADLKDDHFELDNKKFSLIGKRSQKTYKLGDVVWVKIKYCNIEKRTTDLIIVN